MTLSDKKEALIVDFFAGSGTTLHAINLLNAEDDGKRRCIMVTNNEVSETEAKNLAKQGYKPGDPEWEKLGIAQHVTWPRTICSIEGKDVDGKPLEGNYLTNTDKEFPMKKGFVANVKYLKCDWTPRKPEDYLLSNVLCLHIKEMIELQNGYEIDGIRNVLILTKDDFNKAILDETIYKQIENIWLNQNMILNAEEQIIDLENLNLYAKLKNHYRRVRVEQATISISQNIIFSKLNCIAFCWNPKWPIIISIPLICIR